MGGKKSGKTEHEEAYSTDKNEIQNRGQRAFRKKTIRGWN